jgi:hypothetical protein
LTLAVFGRGALGSQKIQGFTARAFDLEGLVNAVAEFFAAGAAADVVHGLLFNCVQPRLNAGRIGSDRRDLTALAAGADARVRMARQDVAQIDDQLHQFGQLPQHAFVLRSEPGLRRFMALVRQTGQVDIFRGADIAAPAGQQVHRAVGLDRFRAADQMRIVRLDRTGRLRERLAVVHRLDRSGQRFIGNGPVGDPLMAAVLVDPLITRRIVLPASSPDETQWNPG